MRGHDPIGCMATSVVGLAFLGIGTVVVGLPLMAFLGGCNPNYSKGSRTGIVNKFSEKGLIYKSHEGEMLLGGMKNTDQGMVANVWEFSVSDPEIIKQIEELMVENKPVTLQYTQYLIGPIQYSTSYRVVKVSKAETK